jgi:Zn-dependent protease
VTFDSITIWYFVALVVAVILHEISHGVVALFFGDDTARRAGRLTLNPVPHIDPFGSIILPLLGALSQIPVIAWAKPVPVNPTRLRNQRRDMLFVSLAGPFTNFGLAIIAAVFARVMYQRWDAPPVFRVPDDLPLLVLLPLLFAIVNMFLGVFNLLPIPPLDGASIIERFLPREWLPGWYRFRQYGILILIVVVFATNIPDRVITPFVREISDFVLST